MVATLQLGEHAVTCWNRNDIKNTEQLRNVPGIRWYNWQEWLLWMKKCKSTSFVALGCGQKEKAWKMENQQLIANLRQCFSTPVGVVQGFLSEDRCDNTVASPILFLPGCSWFLTVPVTEVGIEGAALLWCYWHWECDGRAEKTLTKWLPGMFTTLTVAGRSV